MTKRQWWLGMLVVTVTSMGAVGCTPPAAHHGVAALGGGATFNCALYGNGQVLCWGADEVGQLGRGAPGPASPNATAVVGLPAASRISAGIGDHECAVVTRGRLYCWGSNDSQQLGTIFFPSSATPLPVGGLPPVTWAATGRHHTCAVTGTGGVKCWGSNTFGELGDGSTTPSATPVDVTGLSGAVTVTAGDGYTCALKSDFTVWCWGEGNDGQLGNGQRGAGVKSTAPVQVLDAAPNPNGFGDQLTGITALSAGQTHVCAVKGWGATDGEAAVWCWGTDVLGELGNGSNDASDFAVPAAGLVQSATEGVREVQSGWYHTCAELVSKTQPATSSVICWGGHPGNGSAADSDASQPVPPLTGLVQVDGFSAGFDDTCSLVTAPADARGAQVQSVYCWGLNNNDQLGSTGATTPTPEQVASLPLVI